MSGGGSRKKNNKVQGWEDAGVEFYQENYLSNEVELQDVLRKDPKHLATLLPSKQNRAYSTVRMRCTDTRNRTTRRQTASRSWKRDTTGRRPSAAAEVQVSMLPDLSEPISNEQTAWEQVMRIKELPIPMAEKKQMKLKIQSSPNLRLQGYEQFKWKRRKLFQRFNQSFDQIWSKLELWRSDMKQMEGNFGTGMVAYLLFIKWLLFFNLTVSLVIFIFVILPLLIGPPEELTCDSSDSNNTETDCCLAAYINNTDFKADVIGTIRDIVQGTGRMEYTPFFYGNYTQKYVPYFFFNVEMSYSVPLAYVAITVLILILTLFAIVKRAAKCFRYKIIEGEGQLYRYSNLVFASWDFCIHNEKSARTKKKAIFNETKCDLEVERVREEKKNRTKRENLKISVVRVVINVFEIGVLALCAFLIYLVFEFSSRKLSENLNELENMFYEFLPSICIVIMNLLVPVLFRYLVVYEKYSPGFAVHVMLIRTIFLRLSSIIVLYGSMYSIIIGNTEINCFIREYKCWETFIGQHIYRLTLTDFATHVILTFVVNLPRAILDRSSKNKIAKFIGEQNFDLPKNVLDIVYLQTLCWLGTFYAPLLPAVFVVILFLMFYIKKFVIIVNSKPCKIVHRASTSNFMFMNVLLISFVVAVFPVAYTIGELRPSESCGPFRGLRTSWEIVSKTMANMPDSMRNFTRYLTTAAVTVPMFIVLILLLYYYAAVNNANRHMVRVLKDQLVLEGHDKQFLLERLSQFIRQQQETQKQLRHVDGDMNISSH